MSRSTLQQHPTLHVSEERGGKERQPCANSPRQPRLGSSPLHGSASWAFRPGSPRSEARRDGEGSDGPPRVTLLSRAKPSRLVNPPRSTRDGTTIQPGALRRGLRRAHDGFPPAATTHGQLTGVGRCGGGGTIDCSSRMTTVVGAKR